MPPACNNSVPVLEVLANAASIRSPRLIARSSGYGRVATESVISRIIPLPLKGCRRSRGRAPRPAIEVVNLELPDDQIQTLPAFLIVSLSTDNGDNRPLLFDNRVETVSFPDYLFDITIRSPPSKEMSFQDDTSKETRQPGNDRIKVKMIGTTIGQQEAALHEAMLGAIQEAMQEAI
jgi:hypothetical protein